MRESFWQKIDQAKAAGLTAEQFERIENLEAAIAYDHNRVDEYEKEIKQVE